MARQKLSVLIPAFNEERNIADCIASVRWADEVVVVDSFSTDRTVAIARERADRVLEHEYINSAAQKNWAIPQMTHSWVLVVDSDERVTPELRSEIEAALEADGPADGYRIRRVNHFLGKRIDGCGWQRDWVLRLFRRDRGRYEERHVHADIFFPDGQPAKVEEFQAPFLHFTFDSFDQYLKKFNQYTVWASKDRAARTRKVRWWHLALRPMWRFFRQYIVYGGIRDGLHGFVICWLAAHSVFMKYARLWETQVANQGNETGRSTGEGTPPPPRDTDKPVASASEDGNVSPVREAHSVYPVDPVHPVHSPASAGADGDSDTDTELQSKGEVVEGKRTHTTEETS